MLFFFWIATPAASYANVYERDMEAFDGEKFKQSDYDEGCRDIAAQLVDENSFIDVRKTEWKTILSCLLITNA